MLKWLIWVGSLLNGLLFGGETQKGTELITFVAPCFAPDAQARVY